MAGLELSDEQMNTLIKWILIIGGILWIAKLVGLLD